MKKSVVLILFSVLILTVLASFAESDEGPASSPPDIEWVCSPWSDCLGTVKIKSCYSPNINIYKNITLNCSKIECSNGRLDSFETDIDCGGKCKPCEDGKRCIRDEDCYNLCGPDNECFSVNIKAQQIAVQTKDAIAVQNGQDTIKKKSSDPYDTSSLISLLLIISSALIIFIAGSVLCRHKLKDVKSEKLRVEKTDIRIKIRKLISKANILIDDGSSTEAKKVYKEIISIYSKLSPADKREVHHLIIDLYYRLLPGFEGSYSLS